MYLFLQAARRPRTTYRATIATQITRANRAILAAGVLLVGYYYLFRINRETLIAKLATVIRATIAALVAIAERAHLTAAVKCGLCVGRLMGQWTGPQRCCVGKSSQEYHRKPKAFHKRTSKE